VPGLTDALRDKGEADDALDRRLTFLEGVTTAQGQSLSTMTESVGVAVAGFRGLAVHSGPEHTPDLYVFARQNVDGVPKETWRCHHCMYRELRDASATERTDLYRPAPEPILDPNTQQTSATSESSVRPRTVVASGEGLVDAMRRRR
jgi:sarcosine oxidase delta subunit